MNLMKLENIVNNLIDTFIFSGNISGGLDKRISIVLGAQEIKKKDIKT